MAGPALPVKHGRRHVLGQQGCPTAGRTQRRVASRYCVASTSRRGRSMRRLRHLASSFAVQAWPRLAHVARRFLGATFAASSVGLALVAGPSGAIAVRPGLGLLRHEDDLREEAVLDLDLCGLPDLAWCEGLQAPPALAAMNTLLFATISARGVCSSNPQIMRSPVGLYLVVSLSLPSSFAVLPLAMRSMRSLQCVDLVALEVLRLVQRRELLLEHVLEALHLCFCPPRRPQQSIFQHRYPLIAFGKRYLHPLSLLVEHPPRWIIHAGRCSSPASCRGFCGGGSGPPLAPRIARIISGLMSSCSRSRNSCLDIGVLSVCFFMMQSAWLELDVLALLESAWRSASLRGAQHKKILPFRGDRRWTCRRRPSASHPPGRPS